MDGGFSGAPNFWGLTDIFCHCLFMLLAVFSASLVVCRGCVFLLVLVIVLRVE